MLHGMPITSYNFVAVGLGSFVGVTGLTHFIRPDYYRKLVPEWIPVPHLAAAVSGAADCVAGALLLVPVSRRVGGLFTAALITMYLPAHLDDLRHPRDAAFLNRPAGVAARVAANLSYLALALLVARGARRTPSPRAAE